ncbi:MAG: PIN domain-containing protein [Chloroflexi bacterium]|nr:PIN domain-containing protein [Chloroflexota bacterium]
MNCVVDTHTLVWYFEDSRRLGRRAMSALDGEDNRLIIPTIVLAELRNIAFKGRIRSTYTELLRKIEMDARMETFPLDARVVSRMPESLEMHDAIICATAMMYRELTGEDVVLLTRDEAIQKARIVDTLW